MVLKMVADKKDDRRRPVKKSLHNITIKRYAENNPM